jgi:peptidoglycan L-alanyl-D-glutamate endopeptidase CwlK
MSRRLDDLSARFQPLAFKLLARLAEAGIPVVIVTTSRTPEEQADAVARGVSWTMKSKHLTGDAIDVAPYKQYALHGDNKLQWDASDPVWAKIGAIGQSVGLKWGVVDGSGLRKDLGHLEYVEPVTQSV